MNINNNYNREKEYVIAMVEQKAMLVNAPSCCIRDPKRAQRASEWGVKKYMNVRLEPWWTAILQCGWTLCQPQSQIRWYIEYLSTRDDNRNHWSPTRSNFAESIVYSRRAILSTILIAYEIIYVPQIWSIGLAISAAWGKPKKLMKISSFVWKSNVDANVIQKCVTIASHPSRNSDQIHIHTRS